MLRDEKPGSGKKSGLSASYTLIFFSKYEIWDTHLYSEVHTQSTIFVIFI